jgi:hypothetical protein
MRTNNGAPRTQALERVAPIWSGPRSGRSITGLETNASLGRGYSTTGKPRSYSR